MVAAAARDGVAGAGVVVLYSRPSLAEAATVTAAALSTLATAWPGARFLPLLRRGNVNGALDMGMAPGAAPAHLARAWLHMVLRALGVGALGTGDGTRPRPFSRSPRTGRAPPGRSS